MSWVNFLDNYRYFSQLGMGLDLSRTSFGIAKLSDLESKMAIAFKNMANLEAGGIANPDESRMVGHYWLRTPELAPTAEIKEEIEKSVLKIKAFGESLRDGGTNHFVKNAIIVGIGGSALGPQLLVEALGIAGRGVTLHFLDNTDPDGFRRTFKTLAGQLSNTICLIVSKSGGTVETRNGSLECEAAFNAEGVNYSKHAIAVTCEGSKLDKQAMSEGWLDRFHIWDWVGGRTSIFSAVGLLPAVLSGVSVDEFLDGAKKMDALTRVDQFEQNPAALLAASWYKLGNGKGEKDMVVLPYRDRLVLLSKYLQQLVMESLGKELNLKGQVVNQGIAVYGNKGSTDQHAYVQQLREGLPNFFATFVQVIGNFTTAPDHSKEIEVEPGLTSGDYLLGFLEGTKAALTEKNRRSITLTFDRPGAATLGAIIALFERAVGLYATLIEVNAYHQPGVEAGKKGAGRVVEIKRSVKSLIDENPGQTFSIEDCCAKLKLTNAEETVYRVFEHLAISTGGYLMENRESPMNAQIRKE